MTQATPRTDSGFTLLELMIALGIVAILALIAIPAYLNYSARATAAELLEEIDALRTRYTLATIELEAEGCVVPAHLPDPQLPKPSYAELKVDWHLSTPPLNYRPVLSVLSRSDQQGAEGVHVSRAVHDVLAQNGHLITSGAVLTENLAAFNIYLASQEVKLCAPLTHSTPTVHTPVPQPVASQPASSGGTQPTGTQQQPQQQQHQTAAGCPATHVAYPDGSCARVCNDGFIYNASAHLCQRPQTAPQTGCPPTHVAYPDGSCARVCNDGWIYDSTSGQCQHPSSGGSTSTTGQPAVQTAPSAATDTSTTSGQSTPSSSNGQPTTVTDQGQNKDHGHHYGQQKPHQNHGHHGGQN